MPRANNKDANQPDQCFCCSLPGWYNTLSTCYIAEVQDPSQSAAEQADLSLTWSQTPEEGFTCLICYYYHVFYTVFSLRMIPSVLIKSFSSLKKLSISD